jgi:hypothetical protein
MFWYFVLVAAYLQNALLHRCVDGNASNFLTSTLQIYGNSSFTPAQKLIRGMFVFESLKSVVSIETLVNSSYCFVHSCCCVRGNIKNRFCNHLKPSAACVKYSYIVTCMLLNVS